MCMLETDWENCRFSRLLPELHTSRVMIFAVEGPTPHIPAKFWAVLALASQCRHIMSLFRAGTGSGRILVDLRSSAGRSLLRQNMMLLLGVGLSR